MDTVYCIIILDMTKKLSRKTWLIVIGVLVVVLLIYYFGFASKKTNYQFISVQQGNIVETVSVTGNTTPAQTLDLGFQNGGTVARVNYNAGDAVKAGAVLATLSTSDLQAQLAQAQAAVDSAKATLANLQAGAQPADIQSSEAAVSAAEQSLANLYANVPTALADANAKANDAVRNQLAPLFTNSETSNPQLTFGVSNSQTLNNAQSERVAASGVLNAWQTEIPMLSAASPTGTLELALASGTTRLAVIQGLLATIAQALVQETSLPAATLSSYKAALTNALTEETSASNEVNSAAQNIASQKIAIQQAQAQLNLKLAGSTADQIQAQQAQVEQAQANEQSVQVKIDQASIVAPIDGVVTVQNAKIGEIATPGETMVSLNSTGGLEIDAYVPETDIGKVSVGDAVNITLDAFPGQTFTGKVFYIDPAQTILSGVVDYKIKVSFDNMDPSIRSGLTANLDIKTQEHDNVLMLPQFAVLITDQGSYVEILKNGAVVTSTVTTGIRDENGNIEILTGVTNGEQVLNIGLKS